MSENDPFVILVKLHAIATELATGAYLKKTEWTIPNINWTAENCAAFIKDHPDIEPECAIHEMHVEEVKPCVWACPICCCETDTKATFACKPTTNKT